MLDRLRGRLGAYFLAIGRALARTGLSPTAWTFVGFALALASAGSYWSGGREGELAGGVLLLGSGFLDVADGAVARATGAVSKRGAFLDSTLDRVGEMAVLLGVLVGGYVDPRVVFVALGFSLLVSYTRARAESLGKGLSGVGVGERSERILVLSVASLAGLAGWGVVLVAILAGLTFVERTARASLAL